VWSDWHPPSTAASVCTVTRATLLSGCCAVSVIPAVWQWKRSARARSVFAPKRSFMMRLHMRRAARNFATSSMRLLCTLKKNESCAPNDVDVEPRVDGGLHVGDAVGERERHLLRRVAAGLADVVAADRDRVPLGHLARAPREDVGDEAERGRGG
jgi:hypothetical protein